MKTYDHTAALAIRRQLANDQHRPRYHFLPPANWINDPNGSIQWRGRYHVFYQHNPEIPNFGRMHWGHAVSDDLVHWTDRPLALQPIPDGYDKDGCWSGCAVDNDGVPTFLYTGVFPEVQCLATGSDDLDTLERYAANPVIAGPPADLEVTGFRDPCVWREDGTWYMVIGSGIKDVGGAALLYRSPDLVNWEYLQPILVGDEAETGVMWECPSFFPLGDKHVLIVSVTWMVGVEYFVGTYRDFTFTPEFHRHFDHSPGRYYAPQTFADDAGRRLVLGWVREDRELKEPEESASADQPAQVSQEGVEQWATHPHEAGAVAWAGMHALPRMLTLRPDGLLNIAPVPELATLRGAHESRADVAVGPDTAGVLAGITGDSLELMAEFAPGSAVSFGLKVLAAPGGEEETVLVYDRVAQRLTVDRSRSTAAPDGVDLSPQPAPVPLAAGETLKLHIFIDRSVIEVFANETECLTVRVYPSRADSLGVDVFAQGGTATLKHLDAWQMAAIWD